MSAERLALIDAVELLAAYEGSEQPAHSGPTAEPVIVINATDFAKVLATLRAAVASTHPEP